MNFAVDFVVNFGVIFWREVFYEGQVIVKKNTPKFTPKIHTKIHTAVFSLQIFQHRLYAQQDDEAEESHRRHLEDRSLEKHVADALSHRRLEPASRRRRGR